MLLFTLVNCKSDSEKKKQNEDFSIETYNFSELESFLHKKDDKLYVVNFWATWCKPCVEELPYLLKLSEEKDVELILVSLDLPNMKESQLKPFLQKHNITEKVILLDDPNSNAWIPKVDENWQGAIPATKIYKNDNSKFIARPFRNYEELLDEVEQMM